jgi:hypothetical protein
MGKAKTEQFSYDSVPELNNKKVDRFQMVSNLRVMTPNS